MDAHEVIALLGLQPHPEEGGWFVETWRSAEPYGPDPRFVSRDAGTAIYYLLTPDTVSAMHRLPGDEVFHHYAGGAVDILQLHPDGTHHVDRLGDDLAAGERPQVIVPGGVWQGAIVAPGVDWALLGTTMAPGFAFEDYEHGDVDALAAGWPAAATAVGARSLRR